MTRRQMFCYQCEESAGGEGCMTYGICGKDPAVAIMQDLLLYVTKGISCITTRLRDEGKKVSCDINHLVTQNLEATSTGTNYNRDEIALRISDSVAAKESLLPQLGNKDSLPEAALWTIEERLESEIEELGVLATKDKNIRSVKEFLIYGLKGIASFMIQANELLMDEENVDVFIQRALAKTLDEDANIATYLTLITEAGRQSVAAMALLDKARRRRYGSPVVSNVTLTTRTNPGILVSGHNFRDLEMLLDQSINSGVDIYTHGEMVSAHYYPKFSQYPHLYGNFGASWQQQHIDFDGFNGPILMTTGCSVPSLMRYVDRFWTSGLVWENNGRHISGGYGERKDFSSIIQQAKRSKPPEEVKTGSLIGGFAHKQMIAVSDLIISLLKTGRIKRFIVIIGCDGRTILREYYTELAMELPHDAVIVTAGCVKYRFNHLNLMDVGGIPRILDVGQCSDTYSIIVSLLKLQKFLGLQDINDLPVSFNISWYGQKSIAVLFSLLSLGIKDIHVGPTVPGFLSQDIKKLLKEKYGLKQNGTVNDDLELFCGKKRKESE